MAICKVGTQVEVLTAGGDKNIEYWSGRIGRIVKIEPSELGRVGWEHYWVRINIDTVICINSLEFEVVDAT